MATRWPTRQETGKDSAFLRPETGASRTSTGGDRSTVGPANWPETARDEPSSDVASAGIRTVVAFPCDYQRQSSLWHRRQLVANLASAGIRVAADFSGIVSSYARSGSPTVHFKLASGRLVHISGIGAVKAQRLEQMATNPSRLPLSGGNVCALRIGKLENIDVISCCEK